MIGFSRKENPVDLGVTLLPHLLQSGRETYKLQMCSGTLCGRLHTAWAGLDSGRRSVSAREQSTGTVWLARGLWLFVCHKIKVLLYFKNLRIEFKFLVYYLLQLAL